MSEKNGMVWHGVAFVVSVFVAVTFSILYTGYSNQRNDERWCDLFVSLEVRYRAIPKESLQPDAAKFLQQITELRKGLRCTLPASSPQSPTPARS